jgi:hypothetical protein
MSEMMVDFRRPEMPDNYSDVSSAYNYNYQQNQHQYQYRRGGSSYYADDDAGSLVRSLSQPSLARSASEFTENNWGLRIRSYEDGDDLSSPDHTPRSSFRSTRGPRQLQQQSYSAETEFDGARAAATGANATTGRWCMFGGRTVSAAVWFHDSDENDATYR